MIKRADLFLHQRSQYEALDYFTIQMQKALERAGVNVKLHRFESKDPAPFFKSIEKDRPEITLSFNGLLPDSEGRFLADLIGIPHVACLVDSPSWFIPLKESPLTCATCVDKSHVEFFNGIGFDRALFMTQACDKFLKPTQKEDKIYDVTLLCSCIDIEEIEEHWKKNYSETMVRALLHAVDIALRDAKISYWKAFTEAISIHDPKDPLDLLVMVDLLRELERYINGKDRLDTLKNLKNTPIHVFGDQGGKGSWSYYLKDQSHITLHPSVTFDEHFKIIEQSKILLNNLAKIRYGGGERVFNAFALNTLSLSSQSEYLSEFYEDGKSILFGQWGRWKQTEEKIKHALDDKAYCQDLINQGRAITLEHHTWDNRVHDLLEFLTT